MGVLSRLIEVLMMGRNLKIIIAGSLVYGLAMYLYFKSVYHPLQGGPLDAHVIFTESLFYAVAPFLLGLFVSLLVRGTYSWIYGAITFHVYLVATQLRNLIVFVFIYKLYSFEKGFSSAVQSYLYTAIPATVFVLIGGLIIT